MPLNVRRFYSSIFLAPAVFLSISYGQTTAGNATPQPVPPAQSTNSVTPPVQAPTSGDVMRERIMKAKAFIAVRNYNAAIYELENLRKETADPAVQGVTNVLLMNSYLELGDYKRAQDFLNRFYAEQKTTKAGALAAYSAVAGQVVAGARNRAERYKALGLDPTNRLLPLEALNDLDKMRETLELVITQSKDIGRTSAKTKEAMAILEEASDSRAMLARDTYDAKRWRDEVGDTREAMTTGNMKVLTATTQDGVNGEVAQNMAPLTNTAANTQPATQQQPAQVPSQSVSQPANDTRARTIQESTPSQTNTAKNDAPVYVPVSTQTENKLIQKTVMQQPVSQPQPHVQEPVRTEQAKTEPPKTDTATASDKSVDLGASLITYATSKQTPIIPMAAKTMHTSGIVRVDVTIDEKGNVEVQKASGPSLLQAAAKDAIKHWKFKPYTRDGQAMKVSGFVNFNFTL
jgi:TonB family protein